MKISPAFAQPVDRLQASNVLSVDVRKINEA